MLKIIPILAIILTALAFTASSEPAHAQDCERARKGNTSTPCRIDTSSIGNPEYVIEVVKPQGEKRYCQGQLQLDFPASLTYEAKGYSIPHYIYFPSYGNGGWITDTSLHLTPTVENGKIILQSVGWKIKPHDQIREKAYSTQYGAEPPSKVRIKVAVYHENRAHNYTTPEPGGEWIERPMPASINDHQLLANDCIAEIRRQNEHDATLEAARAQAEADRVAAETAAEEAANAAEIAAIELQSAQDALAAQEALNAALLQETILAIKREDSIRAAWQQVILVRMAGLEERTRIWTEAVERWAAEDLRFSTAMTARIEEVERLQALNAALEQSMTDQRKLLIARLEDLEQAERAAIDSRTDLPQSNSQTDAAAGSGQ